MANQTTQNYQRSIAGSIGAGMGSVFSPSGRKYYILEHKVTSKYHRAGENQEIIIDQIELGRDARCQVRFDESFGTVSRRHASIVRDGDNWRLIQLSHTNTTFLNGRPVRTEWYLQSGDEIQLAVNGPKLNFIIPTGNKSTVGSIALTRRLSLFRQQALRPYKTALAIMACVLLLCICGGGWKLYDLHEENAQLDMAVAQGIENQKRLEATNDSIAKAVVEKGNAISLLEGQIEKLKKEAARARSSSNNSTQPNKNVRVVDNNALKKCDANVFFIYSMGYEIVLPNGEQCEVECGSGEGKLSAWSGTGFMLNDGRFVTARHVVEPWSFISGNNPDENMMMLNAIANNGGSVSAVFAAFSSSGQQITFKTSQFSVNKSGDREYHAEDGKRICIANNSANDCASYRLGSATGGLKYDNSLSRNLERGTKLTVLGFPLGLGANSSRDINPVYDSVVVAADGLQNGQILTTDTNYEHGNSGGPVFIESQNGELIVLGIVSAMAGRNTGFVVPISSVR